jgi:hypothetical protein
MPNAALQYRHDRTRRLLFRHDGLSLDVEPRPLCATSRRAITKDRFWPDGLVMPDGVIIGVREILLPAPLGCDE